MERRRARPGLPRSFSSTTGCVAVAVGVLAAFAGCAGPLQRGPKAAPPLVAYDGAFPILFDDAIDAAAVGIADVAARPRTDGSLRSRTQQAQLVARLRVSTVTVDLVGGQPLYHVQLTCVGSPLVQRGFDDPHLELAVRPESPSFGVVRWLDARLIGRTFIGFARRFAGVEEPQVRFHLSADNAEVLSAVQEAKALAEASGR